MRGAAMSPPPMGAFPWPPQLPAKKRAAKVRVTQSVGKLWKEWLTDYGKHLYDDKYKEPKFLDALCACASDFGGYRDDYFLYQCLFPHMIGFQHSNLQSDNAYYWYDSDDKMDTG